jgi:hypothetical protein
MFQSSQLQYMFLNYDINEVDVSYLNVFCAYTYVITSIVPVRCYGRLIFGLFIQDFSVCVWLFVSEETNLILYYMFFAN